MATYISYQSGNSSSSDFTDVCPKSVFLKYRTAISVVAFLSISIFAAGFLSFSIFFSFLLFGLIGIALSSVDGYIGIKIFTIVYSIATIFAIFFYFIFQLEYGIPYGGGGSDSLAYEQYAAIVAKSIFSYDAIAIGQAIDQPYHNSKGYIYCISILIRFSDFLGGFHTMIPRLMNSAILGICSVVVFHISVNLRMTRQQALNVALVTGLFPIMIYVGVQSLRDIPIVLIMLLSVHLSILIIRSNDFLKILLYVIFFLPLLLMIKELRISNILNLILVLLSCFLVKMIKIHRISYGLIFLSIMSFTLFYISISSYDIPMILDLIERLDSSQSALSEGLDRASEGGLSLVLFNLPIPLNYIGSLFYSFITPLPIIYFQNIDFNFLSIGTIYQFLFIPFIVSGLRSNWRSGEMLPVLVIFLICFMGYVFGSFTFRHITYIVPFAAMYGVLGYDNHKGKRWHIPLIMLVLLVLILSAYLLIKF